MGQLLHVAEAPTEGLHGGFRLLLPITQKSSRAARVAREWRARLSRAAIVAKR